MNKGIIYIHGKGGSAEEAAHYRALFPAYDVAGLDYLSHTPWEAREEFCLFFDAFRREHESVSVIANSIGAFFAMCALYDREIEKACFISPIADMEQLITDMMMWAGVSEQELAERGTIETSFEETLSWEYLSYVRAHPVSWSVPTAVLYGSGDTMQTLDTIRAFTAKADAGLTVMENGEHWFHTEEQMAFLDRWIREQI